MNRSGDPVSTATAASSARSSAWTDCSSRSSASPRTRRSCSAGPACGPWRPSSARRPGRLLVAGHRTPEAGRDHQGGRRRHGGGQRRTGAGVPEDERRPRRGAGADARRRDRRRAPPDLDPVSRRRRLRAPHLLRERRQPPAGAGHRADAGAGDADGARRGSAARRPAALDGKPPAVDRRRDAGARAGRRDSAQRPGADSGGAASRRRHAQLRSARRRVLCRRGAARRPSVRHCAGVAGDRLLSRAGSGIGEPHDHGGWRTPAQRARGRRSGDRGAAALRRGPAAADAARRDQRRPRLPRRERADLVAGSAGLELSDAPAAPAVLRRRRARSGRHSRREGRGATRPRCRSASRPTASSFSRWRAPRRSPRARRRRPTTRS